MRIRMLVSRSGPATNQIPGQIVVCSDDLGAEMSTNEGLRLVAAGQAEPVIVPTGSSPVGAAWEFRNISPEKYLERFPNGPNAQRAREALGQ